MAQKMIDLKKLEKVENQSIQTQTETIKTPEFHIQLNKNTFLKFYRSRIYKDYILTINSNKTKKIVITKPMWQIIRAQIAQIDGAFK